MDATIYAHILEWQGKDPNEQATGQEFTNAITEFRQDLLAKKVIWEGEWKKDWKNWMRTNHVLYSVFTSPKYDEYSKREVYSLRLPLILFYAHNLI